jgi:CRISPR-associated endonuclease/helicase Cas3
MSRFRWPVHFALLNNDCLWVMDETQLMGVGLKTTAQLQAFREAFATCGATHSLWMSATLDESALATVDHPRPEGGWPTFALSEEEKNLPQVQKRLKATKRLSRAKTSLGPEDKAYARELAAEVLNKHVPGHLTLVVVNRVGRGQEVYKSLLKAGRTSENTALIHSRFREPDRKKQEELLWGEGDRIAVATQTIEAGVDVSARVLFTEVAPWPSLVQRFGRLNRYGEFPEALAYWIAIPTEEELAEILRASEPKLTGEKAREKGETALAKQAPPYELEQLWGSMGILEGLQAADIEILQKVAYSEPEKIQPVIRRKDIIELFDTSPDLSGTDLDVSRYIREQENLDVQVYWRDFAGETPEPDQPRPTRAEFCAVPVSGFNAFLGKEKVSAWRWDHLEGAWQRLWRNQLFPGNTILLPSGAGGYDALLGWTGTVEKGVKVPEVEVQAEAASESIEEGSNIKASGWITITRHSQEVAAECEQLARKFELDEMARRALITAALWHDVGKSHHCFQAKLIHLPGYQEGQWAKAARGQASGNTKDTGANDDPILKDCLKRRHFRHELASALAWLQQAPDNEEESDLVAYLIACHHGKVRLAIRSLPGETKPPQPDLPFACGVWHGEELPEVGLGNGQRSGPIQLDLTPMLLGQGDLGPSWVERAFNLRDRFGPFKLAFMEALLRVADWRVSAAE